MIQPLDQQRLHGVYERGRVLHGLTGSVVVRLALKSRPEDLEPVDDLADQPAATRDKVAGDQSGAGCENGGCDITKAS